MDVAAPFHFFKYPHLCVDHVRLGPEAVTVEATVTSATAACPCCGHPSDRVHSRYCRTVRDLPWQGRKVTILLTVRKFHCVDPQCSRSIFCERIPDFLSAHARTTDRQTEAHRLVGLALGGEPGARLAAELAMPTSADTLLRRVKRQSSTSAPLPRFIGIDDWAIRKGQRYGTIIIDLERRRVVELLPGRDGEALKVWLKAHPEVEVVSRDRWAAYAQAINEEAPRAKQVADRWHLLKNLREMIERVFERRYARIKHALVSLQPKVPGEILGSPSRAVDANAAYSVKPAPISPRRQAQQTRRTQRVQQYERVRQLHQDGQSIRRIAKSMGLNRETVRGYLRHQQCPDWQRGRPRPVHLNGFRQSIDQRLQQGCRNAAELHRELTSAGHRVSYYAVRRFVRRRLASLGQSRCVDRIPDRGPRPPSARQLAFALIRRPENREVDEQTQLEGVRAMDAELTRALALADEFMAMVRKTLTQPLSAWLMKAECSACAEMRRFARSLRQDESAIAAALTERWSNGPVEGHVNRLKAIKRQMYGRAGLQLLRARVLQAA